MSMKVLTAVRSARYRVVRARCRASFSTFSASHFGKERLRGLSVKSRGYLFRSKQRPFLERQVRYKRPVANVGCCLAVKLSIGFG
jgi:hypothetical protein